MHLDTLYFSQSNAFVFHILVFFPKTFQCNPLSYTITGGAAQHETVEQKTWRTFTFANFARKYACT